MFLASGTTNSYGVYEEEYENKYSNDNSDGKDSLSPAIIIGAIHLGTNCLFTTIAGSLCERIGLGMTTLIGGSLIGVGLFTAGFCTEVWQLALTQGVLAGAGIGTVFIVVSTIPSSWFSKNQGFLMGVVHSGSGVGGLVLSPLTRFFINRYGLSGSVKIFGTIIVCGISLFSNQKVSSLAKKRMSVRSFGVRDVHSTRGVLRSQEFWYLNIAVMLAEAAFYVVLFFLPVYSIGIGLTSEQGALIAGVANGATIIGRITIGYIADMAGNINMFFLTHFFVTLACFFLWFPAKSFLIMIAFACTFGLFAGSLTPMIPLCSVTLFGQNGLANNVGLLGIGMVLTTTAAPVVARVFYEKIGQSGSGYGAVALFCGGIYLVATLSIVALRMCVSRKIWIKI
ncbi:major facilitator superfamily domain-containing protein [Kickxella alabastrina]|uniref:major facilitator superfamily domain-containing protein n=1 Tax=Kickxella alabastrina TaxID=61397 RepID=UPI00221EC80E|nr:major facilitator superfamily domain-containing protein [Kickxella alabastrina]KAI7834528.1 major facilitator superfamily domain-containing protein [Kickxella alabastrina]